MKKVGCYVFIASVAEVFATFPDAVAAIPMFFGYNIFFSEEEVAEWMASGKNVMGADYNPPVLVPGDEYILEP